MPQFSTAMFPSKLPLIQYAAASVSRVNRCARPQRQRHHHTHASNKCSDRILYRAGCGGIKGITPLHIIFGP